jgi:hypothetical protein
LDNYLVYIFKPHSLLAINRLTPGRSSTRTLFKITYGGEIKSEEEVEFGVAWGIFASVVVGKRKQQATATKKKKKRLTMEERRSTSTIGARERERSAIAWCAC